MRQALDVMSLSMITSRPAVTTADGMCPIAGETASADVTLGAFT